MAKVVSASFKQKRTHEVGTRDAKYRKLLCFGDDNEEIRHQLQQISESNWDTAFISSIDQARTTLKDNHDVLVGLAWLSARNCEEVEDLISIHGEMEWVAVTTEADLKDHSVQYILSHLFYDYHTSPIDDHRLRVMLGHADGMARLRRVCLARGNRADRSDTYYHHMIGSSERMRSVYATIDKVAPTDYPVLITGASGTGKELVARAIHDKSENADQSLVIVNCGAIAPTLIQSELFGHEKGSFTNADRHRKGHFEHAHKGTIFLDEIGELPLEMQANLLRVVEERVIRRVGSSQPIPNHVRILAATNQDLVEAVKAGEFREDLYYRLSVVHIDLPPLAERQDDIDILAKYYLNKFAPEVNNKVRGFSTKAITAMREYSWPGNVRELVNRVKRAVLMCDSRLIYPKDLELPLNASDFKHDSSSARTLKEARENAERELLVQTLSDVKFNVSMAAKRLGVSRVTLYNLLKKYDLQ